MLISQVELKKKIKHAKMWGWTRIIVGGWVFASSLMLIIVAKLGVSNPVIFNVPLGIGVAFWGFRALNEAEKLKKAVK
jgi:hypothetical protein